MIKKLVAIVPMKGHSERVPDKNIRIIGGKPLFYWILNTLTHCSTVEQVYVDTDSKKIAKMCKDTFNVSIIWRPRELRGDFISMNNILAYDINYIGGRDFLQTHATNPLIKAQTIDNAVKKYFSLNKFDSLFSVTKIQSRLYDSSLKPINHDPSNLIRTQDLPVVYEENSNLYIFSIESFKNNKSNRIGKKPFLYEVDKLEAIDIDTREDFDLADALLKVKH